ncbi:MAG: acyl--CoA ligase [Elusimicrobia bacterium]|nr:acyl--CoA ligase [Elusimicrobiota bacterium]
MPNPILKIAERNAGRDFLILAGDGRALTFGEFHASACGLAGRLEALGIGRQDRVLALLPNSAEFALLYFACLHLGAAVVPVNPALHERDIEFIVRNAGAKLLIHSPRTRRLVETAKQRRWELPPLTDRLYKLPWRPPRSVSADDILTVVFTSGTTAFPKAVAHRAGSLLGNARAFNEAMELGPSERFLNLFPLSYSGGFFNVLLAPYLAGASVVMTPGFGPRTVLDFWRVPMAHGVNALWLTPAIAAALLTADRDEAGRAWCRGNVRKVFVGTAPLPVKVKRDFEAAYGAALYESYGLSETLLVAALGPKTGAVEGSVGPPLAGVKLSVRDGRGRSLPAGKEGEVFIKTPHLMAGYLDYEKGTVAPADAEGWFPSGDLGRRTADGRLSVTGRKKDVIIHAGLNVSPRAIEDVLLRHEAVAQAAVVGVPSELAGEEIVAVVKVKPGLDRGRALASVESFCRASFAAASRPSRVLLREEFPTGVTGKVLKRELRDWAAKEAR